MSLLRTAFALGLAGIASSALAGQITCESQQEGRQRCATSGGAVRLVDQLSRTPCIEGRTWGADREGIWVTGGCRAVFEVQDREENREEGRGERSHEWRHGFEDGRRGEFDEREQSRDYREGYRAGKEAAPRNDDQSRDAPRDERRDERRDEGSHEEGAHLPGRARRACVDQATAEQSFGPDQVSLGEVRSTDEGMFKVELRTPAGHLRCVVDRDGNVQSMERR